MPRHAAFGRFRLEILTPKDVVEDFNAVIASAPLLKGLFESTWPDGLTEDKNHTDLVRHLAEFDAEQAFAWIIRDQAGHYLGCAYLKPTPGVRGEGRIFTWIRDREDRKELLTDFNSAFADWITAVLPDDFALLWRSNDGRDGAPG